MHHSNNYTWHDNNCILVLLNIQTNTQLYEITQCYDFFQFRKYAPRGTFLAFSENYWFFLFRQLIDYLNQLLWSLRMYQERIHHFSIGETNLQQAIALNKEFCHCQANQIEKLYITANEIIYLDNKCIQQTCLLVHSIPYTLKLYFRSLQRYCQIYDFTTEREETNCVLEPISLM